MIIIIAALDRNYAIGDKDKMPWWIPEEYQQFLNFIKDQSVIMGRKTWEVFSKDLPSRRNFVISRTERNYERAVVVNSLNDALQQAQQFPEDVFIAGGASVYAQAMLVADKMYLSWIKGDFSGDAWFPEFDKQDWQVERRIDHKAFEFVVYSRILRNP